MASDLGFVQSSRKYLHFVQVVPRVDLNKVKDRWRGKTMSQDALERFVAATATELGVPGVAVGVWADGREVYACHGVTSVENPLAVDTNTMFVLGSVSKTFTATA